MNPYQTANTTQSTLVEPNTFSTQDIINAAQKSSGSNLDVQGTINNAQDNFTVDVPESISDSAVSQNIGIEDVYQAQADATAATTPTTDPLAEIQSGIENPIATSPFDDYNSVIQTQLFGESEPTDAEKSYQDILDKYSERVATIEENINLTQDQAAEQYQLASRERDLADTDLRIAKKTKALRERLRLFEKDSERLALTRDAYEGERMKIEADATAELADEYIIQAAQQGNLTRAEGLVKTAVDNRIRSFEIRNQADQAKLNALIPTLEKEEKQNALKLQFALQERERDIETYKAEQEGIRNMMITAATNGASGDIQRQILSAGSLDQAMSLAGPYIGRYERMKAESTLASASLARRKSLMELALAGDESAYSQLGAFGEKLKTMVAEAESAEEADRILNNEIASAGLQERINRYTANTLENPQGFSLGVGATPFGRSALLSTAATLSPLVAIPGVATNPITAFGAKADFLATATEMVNIAGFDTLIDYKAQGATFGALSEKEFNAIKSASGPLAAYAIINDEGAVTGFRGSDKNVREAFNLAIQELKDQQAALDREFVPSSDQAEIINR